MKCNFNFNFTIHLGDNVSKLKQVKRRKLIIYLVAAFQRKPEPMTFEVFPSREVHVEGKLEKSHQLSKILEQLPGPHLGEPLQVFL